MFIDPSPIPSVLGNLITTGRYTDNPDVVAEMLDTLMAIIKEMVEAIPACVNLPDTMELMNYVRENFTAIFSFLPAVLHGDYLNPILAIPDLLTVRL